MSTLMDPLDEAQTTLVELLWPVFLKNQKFPVYHWVEDAMRRRGFDAAEVIGGFPSISRTQGSRSRYSAIWTPDIDVPNSGSPVCLTVAGLYHVKNDIAVDIIDGFLIYLRAMSAARAEILNHLFDVPNLTVSLREALSNAGRDHYLGMVGAACEHEWLVSNISSNGNGDWLGDIRLPALNVTTIEDYLTAITAVCTVQKTAVLTNRDPRALARSITNFDLTCELVLKRSLVKKPAISHTVWFGQDATSHSDLMNGVSALGILLHELDVPKSRQDPPCGSRRLQPYLEGELPNINKSRVQGATDLMDAIRIIRNSDQHPARIDELVSAYQLLGLAFPVRNPTETWNIIRAQMDAAFNTLQDEILAARI